MDPTANVKAFDWQGLIAQVKKIILTPKDAWAGAKAQDTTPKDFYLNYIMILAAIAPVCGFIGSLSSSRGFFVSLVGQILMYIVSLIGAGISAFILQKLAPKFGGAASYLDALKLVAYSMTPGFVAGVLHISPALAILATLASIYGIYIMWIGIPVMMGVPEAKRLVYLVVSVVINIIVTTLIAAILGMIVFGALFAQHAGAGL